MKPAEPLLNDGRARRAAVRAAWQRRSERRRRALFPHPATAIEIELIALLFSSISALVLVAGGAAMVVLQSVLRGDLRTAGFSAVVVVLALARMAHVRAFRRAGGQLDLVAARRWERQYAIGSYLTCGAVGIAQFAALRLGDPVIAMVVIGILAAYVFSLVLRVSVRPVICTVSALLVIVPTSAGLVGFVPEGTVLNPTYAAAALALVIGILAAAGFEMMRYSYCLIVDQLTVRRDLSRMARKDPLTELPNRISLRDRFEEEAAAGHAMAIHYIDLDHFKAVNDANGHQCGDALLRQVANRMAMCVRAGDMVARLGGDEFAIVQAGTDDREDAADLARRVIAAISEPYTLGELRVRVGATIGIAMAPGNGQELDTLLANADAALYRAKNSRRGTLGFWSEPLAPSDRKVA